MESWTPFLMPLGQGTLEYQDLPDLARWKQLKNLEEQDIHMSYDTIHFPTFYGVSVGWGKYL